MSRYQLRNWIQYKLRVHHDKRYSRNQPIAHVRRSLSILGLTSSIPSETHIHKFLPVDFGAVDLLVHPGLGVGWWRQVVAQIGVAVRANCYLRRVLKPFCPLKYPQKTYACCLSRPGPPPAGARRGCTAPSWRMRIFLSLSLSLMSHNLFLYRSQGTLRRQSRGTFWGDWGEITKNK